MSVRPVDMAGFVQNQHTYSTIKQAEDQRPAVEQHFAHNEGEKRTEHSMHQVHDKGETEKDKLHHDAREGSNNHYHENHEKREGHKEESHEDSKKNAYSTSTVDITI